MNTPANVHEIQFSLHASRRKGGSETPSASLSGTGQLPRVTQVMALAIQFQDMIKRGEARNYADLALLGCLTRERMSQIMELIWLAPDIQREILEFPPRGAARLPVSEVAVRRIAGLLEWQAQRVEWNALKERSLLAD